MRKPSKVRKRHNLGAIFDKHVKSEFEEHDLEATMNTMVIEPYVHHVPILAGGEGTVDIISIRMTLLEKCLLTQNLSVYQEL